MEVCDLFGGWELVVWFEGGFVWVEGFGEGGGGEDGWRNKRGFWGVWEGGEGEVGFWGDYEGGVV